jgi:hypothetical protein
LTYRTPLLTSRGTVKLLTAAANRSSPLFTKTMRAAFVRQFGL